MAFGFILTLGILVLRAASEDPEPDNPKKVHCPAGWDPSPCACYNMSSSTSLFCQNIRSGEELVTIFEPLRNKTEFSELRLYNSNLTSLPQGIFTKATFSCIQIYETSLETIENGDFNGLEITLSALALWKNQLKHIDYSSLHGLKHLQSLHLSSERITEIPDQAFANLPSLSLIDLIANRIETIGEEAFANLSNIREIVFTNNQVPIVKVGNYAFSNPKAKKLRRFIFSRNNLTESALSENSFRGLNTSFIDLQGNKLENIPQEVFETLIQTVSEKPKGVIMGFGNPIKCNQTLKWLIDKPLKFKKTLVGFECPNKKLVSEVTEEDLTS